MQKKKVSRFEYAIAQAAAKNGTVNIEDYEQFTEEEEMQQREDNLKKQLDYILNRQPASNTGKI